MSIAGARHEQHAATVPTPALSSCEGVPGAIVTRGDRPPDRITDLGLQQSVDPRVGHAAQVDVWWRLAGQRQW